MMMRIVKLLLLLLSLCCCYNCINGEEQMQLFGSGISGGALAATETTLYEYTLSSAGSFGVITHFWTTGPPILIDNAIFSYYIDGETEASIRFTPSLLCGVGYDDNQAPWGTKWMGKGANTGGWFNNFKIPFQKSLRVTAYQPAGTMGAFYYQVRGVENLPINIGGVNIPSHARMVQQVVNKTLQPLEYVDVVNVPSNYNGLHFMHVLVIGSGNKNFLEGCYHAYPNNMKYPGILISTGTEDYFDSAFYFDAGEFHLPVSGFTHLNATKDSVTFSAYRFHEMDPMPFQNGFRFEWRNGDAVDPKTGLKCFIQQGGNVVGSPTKSTLISYAWVYVWEK